MLREAGVDDMGLGTMWVLWIIFSFFLAEYYLWEYQMVYRGCFKYLILCCTLWVFWEAGMLKLPSYPVTKTCFRCSALILWLAYLDMLIWVWTCPWPWHISNFIDLEYMHKMKYIIQISWLNYMLLIVLCTFFSLRFFHIYYT